MGNSAAFITYATDLENPVFRVLSHDFAKTGHQLVLVPPYEPLHARAFDLWTRWRIHNRLAFHLGRRLYALRRFLDGLDEDVVVCFLDSYDLVLVGDPGTIVERFRASGVELLFGGELNVYPARELRADYARHGYSPERKQFPFLNGGTWVGYAGAVLRRLRENRFNVVVNDQEYWSEVFLRERDRGLATFEIDADAELFVNTWGLDLERDLAWVGGRLECRRTGTSPAVVHFNGRREDSLPFIEARDAALAGQTHR